MRCGTRTTAFALALLVGLAGCAAPLNPPLQTFDGSTGYRYANVRPDPSEESLFVILAFSGGGTRAAAFSFGLLEGLKAVEYRPQTGGTRLLLDDIDVISSVSGGSFTAAHYVLFGVAGFQRFQDNFLYRNIQGELVARALAPWNWFRLARDDFSRIDLAAELYDEVVFGGATYATLLGQSRRPYLLLNATDITLEARFEFTQDQFDLLCSDLSPVKVARAVAASSAFPGLLSPLTLRNYGTACAYQQPTWLRNALHPDNPPRRATLARNLWSYQDQAEARPWVHMLDGGLADNIGLRGPYVALSGQDSGWSIYSKINAEKIRRVLVITANAKTARDPDWDRRQSPPGLLDVLSFVTTSPMGNYSFETVQLIADHFKSLTRQLGDWRDCLDRGRQQCGAAFTMPAKPPDVDFHAVELSFDGITDDPALQRCLEGMATSFHLPTAQVTLLRQVARRLLMTSKDFKAAMSVIDPSWQPSPAPIEEAVRREACGS